MPDIVYTLAFSHLFSFNPSNALLLYEAMPSVRGFFEEQLLPPNLSPRLEQRLKEALEHKQELLDRAQRELDFCREKNIQVLAFNDPGYPVLLRQCPDAPLVLFYLGTASLNAPHTVAVVGTRRITDYGRDLCRHFCADLSQLLPDVVVVSGLAYGVDIHAHKAALEEGLPTVGVLAHGLDTIYPSLHRTTASQMVKQGGLLTEYFSHTQPRAENFVRRNRIVAGMCAATVVVESAAKGGALITAGLAQDYNRSVFAFPGRISDQYSDGCNALIRQNGATLITSASQLVDDMNWAPIAQPVQREMFLELTPQEEAVRQCLDGKDRKAINQLVVELDVPIQQLTALLFDMEMRGLVAAVGGGFYRWLK